MDKSTQELVDDGFKYQSTRDTADKAFTEVKTLLKDLGVTDASSQYGTVFTSVRPVNKVDAEKLAKLISGSDELVEVLKCANFNVSKLTEVLGKVRVADVVEVSEGSPAMTFKATPEGKKKLEGL